MLLKLRDFAKYIVSFLYFFFILLFVKKVLACIEPNQKRWTMFYEKRGKKAHPQLLTQLVKHGRSFVSILLHHFHVFVHFCSVKASKIKIVDSKYAFGLRMYSSVLLKRACLLVTFVFQQLWGHPFMTSTKMTNILNPLPHLHYPQERTINLLFKNNRIWKHVANFKAPLPPSMWTS